MQYLAAQNKGLQTQLSESRRKQAEAECKSKEEVMAVRLREADSMAAVAEMRQRIAELEIQVSPRNWEEGEPLGWPCSDRQYPGPPGRGRRAASRAS